MAISHPSATELEITNSKLEKKASIWKLNIL